MGQLLILKEMRFLLPKFKIICKPEMKLSGEYLSEEESEKKNIVDVEKEKSARWFRVLHEFRG